MGFRLLSSAAAPGAASRPAATRAGGWLWLCSADGLAQLAEPFRREGSQEHDVGAAHDDLVAQRHRFTAFRERSRGSWVGVVLLAGQRTARAPQYERSLLLQ